MKRFCLVLLSCCAVALLLAAGAADNSSETLRSDAQLQAMADELARAQTLQLNELDKPYFIQYSANDTKELVIDANLGGLTRSTQLHVRQPNIIVRVGDYTFDNTNSIYSGIGRFGLFPLDDDYQAMRISLWRTTDVLYKAAMDQITRKRNAVREISEPDKTADLARAKVVRLIEPVSNETFEKGRWEPLLRAASARFAAHDGITGSSVRLQMIGTTYRLLNSEGTMVRLPQNLNEIEVRAHGKAADGRRVWNHVSITTLDSKELDGVQLSKVADEVAAQTDSLMKAPLAEEYTGPVLFEGEAAAQMMAQVLTDAITLHRKPVAPPGTNEGALQMIDSVWSTRVGSRVAPEWLTVFDDPRQEKFENHSLAGHYLADDEGVEAQRVSLIDKGTLKGFLLSRVPVRNFSGSNGHGRLPGPFGAEAAVIGNLFVEAAQPLSEPQLRERFIDKVKAAGLKYGLVIRRLDFPSTAALGDLQSMAQQLRKNGYARTLNEPLLAYRVYPDGREQLVRGLRFREFSAKDLRDVESASDHPYVFNYINNGSSLNFADLRTDATTSAVVCPSLLFESVELSPADTDAGTSPIVPPPVLTVGQ